MKKQKYYQMVVVIALMLGAWFCAPADAQTLYFPYVGNGEIQVTGGGTLKVYDNAGADVESRIIAANKAVISGLGDVYCVLETDNADAGGYTSVKHVHRRITVPAIPVSGSICYEIKSYNNTPGAAAFSGKTGIIAGNEDCWLISINGDTSIDLTSYDSAGKNIGSKPVKLTPRQRIRITPNDFPVNTTYIEFSADKEIAGFCFIKAGAALPLNYDLTISARQAYRTQNHYGYWVVSTNKDIGVNTAGDFQLIGVWSYARSSWIHEGNTAAAISGERQIGVRVGYDKTDMEGILTIGDMKVILLGDQDGDGYLETQWDCDDTNKNIRPGVTDACGDGVDQDCSGSDRPCSGI